MVSSKRVSFAIGDVVEFTAAYIKKHKFVSLRSGKRLVTDISIRDTDVAYAVDGNAWFESNELQFVGQATKQTLQDALRRAREADGDEDEDDPFATSTEGGDLG